MKRYICPHCGKVMYDDESSTRFRCQFCKELVYDPMAEGGLPNGPMKDKWLKLMHTSRDNEGRDYCMDCHHYKWYKDEECIKLSCHVDMLEEKPCFEKRYVE